MLNILIRLTTPQNHNPFLQPRRQDTRGLGPYSVCNLSLLKQECLCARYEPGGKPVLMVSFSSTIIRIVAADLCENLQGTTWVIFSISLHVPPSIEFEARKLDCSAACVKCLSISKRLEPYFRNASY